MKIATLILRILLGLLFFAGGAMFFIHPMPMPPPATDYAKDFFSALAGSGFLAAVKVLETLGGLLVLSGRFTPLGLLILGPIIVCIGLFNLTMDRSGLPMACVLGAAALFLAWRHPAHFGPFFKPA